LFGEESLRRGGKENDQFLPAEGVAEVRALGFTSAEGKNAPAGNGVIKYWKNHEEGEPVRRGIHTWARVRTQIETPARPSRNEKDPLQKQGKERNTYGV